MSKQIPWLRVFVEGVVIVGSILLAFGIDAAWEERQERSREAEYLVALTSDVEEVIAEAERTIAANEGLDELSIARVRALTGASPVPDSLYRQSRQRMGNTFRLRANLDAYSALISAGGVSILQSPALRESLAKLQAEMDFEEQMMVSMATSYSSVLPEIITTHASGAPALEQLLIDGEEVGQIWRSLHTARKRDVLRAAYAARDAISLAKEAR